MKSEADLEEFGEAADLLDTIQRNVLRGRFYFTKSRRMGLAPIGAAIGDRIAIFTDPVVRLDLSGVRVVFETERYHKCAAYLGPVNVG